MLRFIEPAPAITPIENQQEAVRSYRHWRLQVFFSMYAGYAFYYVARRSLSFLFPLLRQELSLSYTDIGIFTTVMTATYGVSKFANGVLADRANPRWIMPIGLVIAGLCNFFMGMLSTFWLFVFLWAINGWFQGFGWPACARLLTHWYGKEERGTWWGVWNTSHNFGGAVTPIIIPLLAAALGWRYALMLPALTCVLVGVLLYFTLCDTPQSEGLPPIEEYPKLLGKESDGEGQMPKDLFKEEKELSARERLVEYVLENPYLWLLGAAYFFVYVVRTAINDWSPIYLVEERGYTQACAGQVCSWFEIGGFLGGLSAGLFSDRIYRGMRGPVNVIYMALSALSILPWIYLDHPHPIFDSVVIFFLGFFLFGPQMLIGVAAAELSHKKSAATATGFISFFANIGGMCAGIPLGMLIQNTSWHNYFFVMLFCCLGAVVVLIPLWDKKGRPR